jgi:hypothetical protein
LRSSADKSAFLITNGMDTILLPMQKLAEIVAASRSRSDRHWYTVLHEVLQSIISPGNRAAPAYTAHVLTLTWGNKRRLDQDSGACQKKRVTTLSF